MCYVIHHHHHYTLCYVIHHHHHYAVGGILSCWPVSGTLLCMRTNVVDFPFRTVYPGFSEYERSVMVVSINSEHLMHNCTSNGIDEAYWFKIITWPCDMLSCQAFGILGRMRFLAVSLDVSWQGAAYNQEKWSPVFHWLCYSSRDDCGVSLNSHHSCFISELSLQKITVGKIYAGLLVVENWRAFKASQSKMNHTKAVSNCWTLSDFNISTHFSPSWLFIVWKEHENWDSIDGIIHQLWKLLPLSLGSQGLAFSKPDPLQPYHVDVPTLKLVVFSLKMLKNDT
jgi:hypothetical protein